MRLYENEQEVCLSETHTAYAHQAIQNDLPGMPAPFTLNSSPALPAAFKACYHKSLLREAARAFGFELAGETDEKLFQLYLNEPQLRLISPNPGFDELWYRGQNPDVIVAIKEGQVYSGFTHYISFGIFEGRWPNQILQSRALHTASFEPEVQAIDVAGYLAAYPAAKDFLQNFPLITALEHYNLFGRFLGYRAPPPGGLPAMQDRIVFDQMAREFDAAFYRNTYLKDVDLPLFGDDPFTHYLLEGIKKSYSPSGDFDETWYRAFYGEVRVAIQRGDIISGFYHYIAAGRAEGRLPAFDRKLALEARMPGVTRPVLLHRVAEISRRMMPRGIVFEASPPRLWFLMPTMNPDITFGGYRGAFELINAAHKSGYAVGIICTEDAQADKDYFLWRETSKALRQLVLDIPILNAIEQTELKIGVNDTIIAYSVWDLYTAHDMRKVAPDLRVVLLTQEYEPIFYDNCSSRAIAEEAYALPHFPIINSQLLCKFLKAHKVGVFGKTKSPVLGKDYAVFEHRINILPSQTVAALRARREKVLVAYARPEGHAARNMFEILILALQTVCAEGLFDADWSFVGLGALTETDPVPLGGGHELVLHPKMTEEQYTGYIACMDIGVSLMFAPHPSVVPFEFATTGAIVVTNTYENRSAAELAAISKNIVAGPPSIAGIAETLRRALQLIADAETRVANIYQPENTSWSAIFNAEFLQTIFGPPAKAAA